MTKLGITPLTDRQILMTLLLDKGHELTEKERTQAGELLAALEMGVVDKLAKATRDKFFAIGRSKGLFGKNEEPLLTPAEYYAAKEKKRHKSPQELAMLKAMADKDKWLPKRPPGRT